MKCGYCNGTGEHINDANRMTTCEFCGGTGVIKPLTNEEWLKQCTTEQLAKVLYNFFMARTFCHLCPEEGVCDIGYECKYDSGEVKDFVEWLKQPHTEKE